MLWLNPRNICPIRTSQALSSSKTSQIKELTPQLICQFDGLQDSSILQNKCNIEPPKASDHGYCSKIVCTCSSIYFQPSNAVTHRDIPPSKPYARESYLQTTAVPRPNWSSWVLTTLLQRSRNPNTRLSVVKKGAKNDQRSMHEPRR